jgi:hypothetical protein
MKTFAHINTLNEIVGIGMIYFETGELTHDVQEFVTSYGEEDGIRRYGDMVRPLVKIGDTWVPDPDITAIVIDTDEMPGGNGLGYDKTFYHAFKHGGGRKIDVDMPKAKELTHDKRRAKRAAEFGPLDIEATIPDKQQDAEAKRQAVRDKYTVIQGDIDSALTPDELKEIINKL